MEQKKNAVHAKLLNIETEQFAIFEENFSEDTSNPDGTQLEMGISAGFGGSIEEKGISSSLRFELFQNDKTIILIETTLYFRIFEDSWKKFYNKKNNIIKLPRLVAIELFSHAIGTCRGVLTEKTAGKQYIEKMHIPILNAGDFVDTDIEIDFNSIEKLAK
jgi:hypothetical protein